MIVRGQNFLSNETIQISSIRECMNESSLFFHRQIPQIPQSFKAIIMLSMLQKYANISSDPKKHELYPYFIKIYAFGKRAQAIDRFLINRSLNVSSFFYRIKKQTRQIRIKQTSQLPKIQQKSQKNPTKLFLRLEFKYMTRLRESFLKIILFEPEIDFQSELMRAKRNLQLLEHNLQMQDEVDMIYKGYEEQMQVFQVLENQIQKMKVCLKETKIQTILSIMKRMYYPNMREFFRKLEENFKVSNERKVMDLDVGSYTSLSLCSQTSIFQKRRRENNFRQSIDKNLEEWPDFSNLLK